MQRLDFIISDISMPEMDDYQFIQEIKGQTTVSWKFQSQIANRLPLSLTISLSGRHEDDCEVLEGVK